MNAFKLGVFFCVIVLISGCRFSLDGDSIGYREVEVNAGRPQSFQWPEFIDDEKSLSNSFLASTFVGKEVAYLLLKIHSGSSTGPIVFFYSSSSNTTLPIIRNTSDISLSFQAPLGTLYMFLIMMNTATGSGNCSPGTSSGPYDCASSNGTDAINNTWALTSNVSNETPTYIGNVDSATTYLPDVVISEVGMPWTPDTTNNVRFKFCHNSGALQSGSKIRIANYGTSCTTVFGQTSSAFSGSGRTVKPYFWPGTFPLISASGGSFDEFMIAKPLFRGIVTFDFSTTIYGSKTTGCVPIAAQEIAYLVANGSASYDYTAGKTVYLWIDDQSC